MQLLTSGLTIILYMRRLNSKWTKVNLLLFNYCGKRRYLPSSRGKQAILTTIIIDPRFSNNLKSVFLSFQRVPDCQEYNFKIKQERPIFEVPDISFDSLLHIFHSFCFTS